MSARGWAAVEDTPSLLSVYNIEWPATMKMPVSAGSRVCSSSPVWRCYTPLDWCDLGQFGLLGIAAGSLITYRSASYSQFSPRCVWIAPHLVAAQWNAGCPGSYGTS